METTKDDLLVFLYAQSIRQQAIIESLSGLVLAMFTDKEKDLALEGFLKEISRNTTNILGAVPIFHPYFEESKKIVLAGLKKDKKDLN